MEDWEDEREEESSICEGEAFNSLLALVGRDSPPPDFV